MAAAGNNWIFWLRHINDSWSETVMGMSDTSPPPPPPPSPQSLLPTLPPPLVPSSTGVQTTDRVITLAWQLIGMTYEPIFLRHISACPIYSVTQSKAVGLSDRRKARSCAGKTTHTFPKRFCTVNFFWWNDNCRDSHSLFFVRRRLAVAKLALQANTERVVCSVLSNVLFDMERFLQTF